MRYYFIGFDLSLDRDYSSLWLLERRASGLELLSLVCLPPRTDYFLQLRVLDDMIVGLGPDVHVVLVTDKSGYSAWAADDTQRRHPEIRIEHVAADRLMRLAWPPPPPKPLRTRAERLAEMREGLALGVIRMADHFEWAPDRRNGVPVDRN